MILSNGRIHTMDAAASIVDTVVVRDGRVTFAGRRADVNAGAGEIEADLGGRTVLPGLVDAHAHLMNLAKARLEVGVRGLPSERAAAAVVADAATRVPSGEWITGRGWDQTLWPGGACSTRPRPIVRWRSRASTVTRSGPAPRRCAALASTVIPATPPAASSSRTPAASRRGSWSTLRRSWSGP
jgi:hypothetical protein